MQIIVSMLGGLVVIAPLCLVALRLWDALADRALTTQLTATKPNSPAAFHPDMLRDLPEPAARFFRFAITPGTPLQTTALIDMTGTLSLDPAQDPDGKPMIARQVLSPPQGFIWQLRLQGPTRITGTDACTPATSYSRFRVADLMPVARAGGDTDHHRSAFGRMVGEALIWSPAAFLPAARAGWDHLAWRTIDPHTAEVTVRLGALEQRARLALAPDGRPKHVVFERWSNENPDRVYQFQAFGGALSDFKTFDGVTLPTEVTGGNHFGTLGYAPFYRARVTQIAFV